MLLVERRQPVGETGQLGRRFHFAPVQRFASHSLRSSSTTNTAVQPRGIFQLAPGPGCKKAFRPLSFCRRRPAPMVRNLPRPLPHVPRRPPHPWPLPRLGLHRPSAPPRRLASPPCCALVSPGSVMSTAAAASMQRTTQGRRPGPTCLPMRSPVEWVVLNLIG